MIIPGFWLASQKFLKVQHVTIRVRVPVRHDVYCGSMDLFGSFSDLMLSFAWKFSENSSKVCGNMGYKLQALLPLRNIIQKHIDLSIFTSAPRPSLPILHTNSNSIDPSISQTHHAHPTQKPIKHSIQAIFKTPTFIQQP